MSLTTERPYLPAAVLSLLQQTPEPASQQPAAPSTGSISLRSSGRRKSAIEDEQMGGTASNQNTSDPGEETIRMSGPATRMRSRRSSEASKATSNSATVGAGGAFTLFVIGMFGKRASF